MSGLTAVSAAERAQALERRLADIERHRHKTVSALEKQQMEANQGAERDAESARALVEAHAAERDAKLAKEIAMRIDALVAQFVHAQDADGNAVSPRVTAAELSRVWREFAAKALAEIGPGEDIDARHIGWAFLALQGEPEMVRAASYRDFWTLAPIDGVARASRALLEAKPAPVIEEALRQCDVAIASSLRQPQVLGSEQMPDRLAVYRGHASSRRVRVALVAFDEATDAARAKETADRTTREQYEREREEGRKRTRLFG